MEDRTQLKIAFKSMRKASKALRRSVKTNESEVERLRLADDFRKKAQGWVDLIAKGDTARKSPRESAVKRAVKRSGPSRKKVERRLRRKK